MGGGVDILSLLCCGSPTIGEIEEIASVRTRNREYGSMPFGSNNIRSTKRRK